MASLRLWLVLAPAVALAGSGHFDVLARFVPPAKSGQDGAIAVSFTPREAEVRLNEEPAPRLKLDAAQTVLVDRQEPRKSEGEVAFNPAQARYLDVRVPVRFPVAFAKDAPKGVHSVKASVTYFYCSKREGWCRKGTSDVEVPVVVP